MSNYKLKYSGEKIDEILTKADGMSEVVTATGETAGKVKLSDATDSESDASAGVAATPKAVKAAFDAASAAGKVAGDLNTKVGENTTAISENATAIGKLEKDIDNLSSSKISKFYASSQGNTNLPDSDNGKIIDLKLYGKGSQKQYSGKNLFPPVTYSGNVSNLQIDAADGVIHLKGTPNDQVNSAIIGAWSASSPTIFTLPAGTYTLSGFGVWLSTPRLNLVYVENGELTSLSGNKTVTFDKETNFIAVFVYANANAALDITFKPMIEKGSTATDYEPYVGGIPSPNPEYPQEIKSVVNPVVTISDGADKQQTAALPYTLNAIPVSSGGNITIDGQQYIADYVDVERGKLIQKNFKYKITGNENIYAHFSGWIYVDTDLKIINEIGLSNVATSLNDSSVLRGQFIRFGRNGVYFTYNDTFTDVDTFKAYVKNTDVYIIAALQEPIETDLTADEIAAFKALVSYYPVTNVSTTSEQLDGYTVFNYQISLANGWNYVKQQIGDTRDYLYDIDLMTAEAYVNSEYAAALAEIEV